MLTSDTATNKRQQMTRDTFVDTRSQSRKTEPKQTELDELVFRLAKQPTVEGSLEAYVGWLIWCVEWQALTPAQAKQTIDSLIQKLGEVSRILS